jgi:uncharacterized protein YukE
MNEPRATDTSAPISSDQAQEQPPMDTRDLRDAQAAGERERSAAKRDRPPIRAAGAKPEQSKAAAAGLATAPTPERKDAPLFDEAAGRKLRDRWMTIQTEFVDEPRDAVQKADSLVAEVLNRLTDTFAREREELEAGWSGAGGSEHEVSTEDLRQAIRRYRSFFNRLLSL